MRIAVDVDLTVVDLANVWLGFLNRNFEKAEEIPETNVEYNLGAYFSKPYKLAGFRDPLFFWSLAGIYDFGKPLPFSEEAIAKLASEHEVFFVSKCCGDHFASKVKFLNKYFPNLPLIATDRKDLIACDVMIDDRNEFLNMTSAKLRYKIKTRYTQTEKLTVDVIEIDNLQQVVRDLCKNEEVTNG